MSDSGCGLSLHEQIKLASEWGYNQDEIIAALKANTNGNSMEFERFENVDIMLDILSRVSGKGGSRKHVAYQPGDMMSSSTTSLSPHHSHQSNPRRSLSVARSSSFHLSTPKSTRDSHDIVRLLATLEKEKERDRKEVDSQFTILKNRINFLELEKNNLLQDIQDLKDSIDMQSRDLQFAKEEANRLMEEKIEATETLDKLTIQNYRQLQEIHDQKELAEHRKKIYSEEKLKRDEEIANLQKQKCEVESELEQKSALLDAQTEIAKQLEKQNYQLQPLILLEDITKKHRILEEMTSQIVPNFTQLQLLYQKLFDTYPQMEENFRKERESNIQKVNEIEEKLNSRNRDFHRLQEKCVAECCICLNTKPSIVFLPCRHLISCSDCYEKSNILECPTCRSSIENAITVFM